MNLLLLLNTENLGFDIESQALVKSYPLLKYFFLFRNNSVLQLSMYQHLTECKTHAENMQFSFCSCNL